jgi:MFS superfamily sulfate permease-like transporter
MSTWRVPPTLRDYRASWLSADALAGLALVAVALPSQMATAQLANLPAVAGLYAFVAGSLLYAALGTNRHLSVGADSTIAPILAVGVAAAAAGTSGYSAVMAFTALLVGALLVVAGLCRLGWIAEFLSTPVIDGLLAGIAVEIVVRQIPVILGVTGGGTTTVGRIRSVAGQLSHINGWSAGIAVGVLVLIAVGAGSIAAGLAGAFAVDASPPNTAIAAASGARSQLAQTMAAVIVLAVVLVATAPLAYLPRAMLGAILVFIATKLLRVSELRAILRFDRIEFGLAATALLVVALVGIEQGVVLAMILSLADRTRRSARPSDAVLGRETGTDHWIPSDIGRPTEQVPGVLAYLVYAPLWYGNADYLRLRIRHLIDTASQPVQVVILDADGMSDIDYTGLQALRDLTTELGQRGIAVGIARASHLVHHNLKHGALLKQIGADHLFASVEGAVAALRKNP